jgi:hypothetical protein
VLAIAKRLREVPNTVAAGPTKFDEVVEQTSEQPALQTWASAFAVAERLGHPLYSDDRFIRAQARREGMRTFGTIALLEALVERGRVTAAMYAEARRRLRASGAVGVPPTEAELLEEAEECGWKMSASLRQALLDPASWRDVSSSINRHASLLRQVHEHAPSRFSAWVVRVIGALKHCHPGTPVDTHARVLLAAAWATEDAPFVKALIDALREMRATLGLFRDPVPEAFDLLLSFARGKPAAFQTAMLASVIRKIDAPDQIQLLQRLQVRVQPGSPAEESGSTAKP